AAARRARRGSGRVHRLAQRAHDECRRRSGISALPQGDRAAGRCCLRDPLPGATALDILRIVGWLRLAFPRSRRLANIHVWLVKTLPQAYGRPASRGLIALYLLLSLMGVALLLATGYLGEAMVYRFGMGIFNPAAPLT